jgi:hypothetical protein
MSEVKQVTSKQYAEVVAELDHARRMDEAARAPHLTLQQKLTLQRFAKEARIRARDIGG